MAKSGIPISELSGSGATRELHDTIKAFNEQTAEQTAAMIRLTRAIAVLTGLMLIGLVAQIIIALPS